MYHLVHVDDESHVVTWGVNENETIWLGRFLVMSLLIDADYIVYKCVQLPPKKTLTSEMMSSWSRADSQMRCVLSSVIWANISNDMGIFDDSVLFFSSSRNFRKEIAPDYKGHRQRKKPCGYRRVINELSLKLITVVIEDGLEADDALGIYATAHPAISFVVLTRIFVRYLEIFTTSRTKWSRSHLKKV